MDLSETLPERGIGEDEALAVVSREVERHSTHLGGPEALAHMDPPTPDVAARLVGLNAVHNQNLLHPDLSPFATEAERTVIDWLAPSFGMAAGHMCAGSTVANLAALWCAREHGADRVIASADAHVSIPKAARILGLRYEAVPTNPHGCIDAAALPGLRGAALVLTLGTTGRGAIDDPALATRAVREGAAWVHADAAWAGPLRLTRHAGRLDGIEGAHSAAVSAHKWLFQPKDSALVLLRDPAMQDAISFGGAYLAVPNIGVQGSRGAAGVALLGTLMAWGREGLAERIERCMALTDALADRLETDGRVRLKERPRTGVVNWRPREARRTEEVIAALRPTASRTAIDGEPWVRQVAANPHADLEVVWARIDAALQGTVID